MLTDGLAMWSVLFQYLRYLVLFGAAAVLMLLILSGHWLGIFYAVLAISVLVLAVVLWVGEALGKPWAQRLSRILFMR